jgi:signal transduction histidine kinase
MDWVTSFLRSGTAETLLVQSVFHLLAAGITLIVLVRRRRSRETVRPFDAIFSAAFLLILLNAALLTIAFGSRFFVSQGLSSGALQTWAHALLSCGLLLLAAAFERSWRRSDARWWKAACGVVVLAAVLESFFSLPSLGAGGRPHSPAMLVADCGSLLALLLALRAARHPLRGSRAHFAALSFWTVAWLFHAASLWAGTELQAFSWEAEGALVAVALFLFAWAAAEDSRNLLDRIFVRLNLVFIVLAAAIMLISAGHEKQQYFRIAEERSLNAAESLRAHMLGMRVAGHRTSEIIASPELLERAKETFTSLPELRHIDVYLQDQRVRFAYGADWYIHKEVSAAADWRGEGTDVFRMVSLPVVGGAEGDRVEFVATMDYINGYIGKYVIFIYSTFTIMVALATGIIGIIVAETDRQLRRRYEEVQQSQQQLVEAAKLASVGELAGGVAHEINTPITSILSLASHLADERNSSGLTPRQRKSLQLMAEQAARAARIVGGLLTFSRNAEIHLAPLDVRDPIDTALTLINYRLSRIEVRRVIDSGLPEIQGDAGRLTEVLVNLLNNAIDAMPAGGTLVLRAAADGDGVRLEISDSGVGISAQDLPRIFDPFFTTKEPGRGTGLGLSISHGIVQQHGGDIKVHSRVGEGTTFVVTLPGRVPAGAEAELETANLGS